MLIYRAVPTAPACVGQVSPDAALEEALAALACELTVVFPGAFVATHHTLDLLLVAVRHTGIGRGCTVVVVTTAAIVIIVVIVVAAAVVVIVVAATVVVLVAAAVVMMRMMWRGDGRWDRIHGNDGGARVVAAAAGDVAAAVTADSDGVADGVMGERGRVREAAQRVVVSGQVVDDRLSPGDDRGGQGWGHVHTTHYANSHRTLD